MRRVLRTLHAGHGVAVLIDQHVTAATRSTWISSGGRPRRRRRWRRWRCGPARRSCRCSRCRRPRTLRLIYEHPVEPPRADSPDAIQEFTQRCTDVLEMSVRRHPELWLWMHRRWRDEARGEGQGMFPSAERDVDVEPTPTHQRFLSRGKRRDVRRRRVAAGA